MANILTPCTSLVFKAKKSQNWYRPETKTEGPQPYGIYDSFRLLQTQNDGFHNCHEKKGYNNKQKAGSQESVYPKISACLGRVKNLYPALNTLNKIRITDPNEHNLAYNKRSLKSINSFRQEVSLKAPLDLDHE